MPSTKRKRDGTTATPTTSKPAKDSESPSSRDAIDAIFRKHFESRFGAVELEPVASSDKKSKGRATKKSSRRRDESEDDEDDDDDDEMEELSEGDSDEEGSEDAFDDEDVSDEDDDWDGLDSKDDGPEVVEYEFSRRGPTPSVKPSHRSFMTSKPPSSSEPSSTSTTSKPSLSTTSKESSTDDILNLKNDIALQRLLQESHLLDSTTLTHSSGKARHKAIESRIQSLGGTAISTLDGSASRVPMKIRKGMSRKQEGREEKRRRIAKDSGIVLAKGDKKRKKSSTGRSGGERKRDAGVGNPSVGRFRKGALVLNKKEVMRMKA